MRTAPFDPPLLLVTDRRRFAEPRPGEGIAGAEERVLRSIVEAGVGAIQLREKDLDGSAVYDRARYLVSLCGPSGPRVLVNDRADVARAANAAGVHLPETGLPVESAREIVGPNALIGRSIHAREELSGSLGSDYLIFGPIFDTPSKRRYGAPQGLTRLAQVARATKVPVLAIGGITVERVHDVVTHGASGIAVMGALLEAVDPAASVRAFRAALAAR